MFTASPADGIPLATAWSVLAPSGVDDGKVKLVADCAPLAIVYEKPLVRVYVTTWVALLVIRTSG